MRDPDIEKKYVLVHLRNHVYKYLKMKIRDFHTKVINYDSMLCSRKTAYNTVMAILQTQLNQLINIISGNWNPSKLWLKALLFIREKRLITCLTDEIILSSFGIKMCHAQKMQSHNIQHETID
jgi:hypothetical protein